MFTLRKVGGLYHWRIGRLGGSVYLAKARKPVTKPVLDAYHPRFTKARTSGALLGIPSNFYTPLRQSWFRLECAMAAIDLEVA